MGCEHLQNQGSNRSADMLQDYTMISAMVLVWNTTHYLL